jgi:hypothetical protein
MSIVVSAALSLRALAVRREYTSTIRRPNPRAGGIVLSSGALRGPGRVPLTLFYFDVETTGDDPQQDRIVSVQYRQLGDAFEPVGELQILVEWEWGEKQIVQAIMEKGALVANWDFVPVGNRVRFDLTFLVERATKWGLLNWDAAQLKYFWYTKPFLDLQTVLVLMNRGQFTGSSLQAFADKESGSKVPILYRGGRYAEIIAYVTKEQEAALTILRETLDLLGPFGDARRRT